MVIASSIDGRLRIRDEMLRNAAAAEAVRSALMALPGIREVSTNLRAGSLLVLYGQAQTTLGRITDLLSRYLRPAKAAPAAPPVRQAERPAPERRSQDRRTGADRRSQLLPGIRRRAVNLGMLVSLLVSMAGAVLGAEALHIVAGVLFLGTLAIHLFDKRRSLFV